MSDKKLTDRIKHYSRVSKYLNSLDEAQLSDIVTNSKLKYTGLSIVSKIKINDTYIFVKQIPLTMLENIPSNRFSTKNLFKLPNYYQYGIGSAGFGAWRELKMHTIANYWVHTGACQNFPMMYHWRLMSTGINPYRKEKNNLDFDKMYSFWNKSTSIKKRFEGLKNSDINIVLFLEYIPHTLDNWLNKKSLCSTGDELLKIEKSLLQIISFFKQNEILHFDIHFSNVLTDGLMIFLSDFGLAITTKFALSKIELDFFKKHQNYDTCSVIYALTYHIITKSYGKRSFDKKLREFANNCGDTNNYILITLMMSKFYKDLIKNKSTEYPSCDLNKLLS